MRWVMMMLAAMVLLGTGTAVAQGDPFENARYYVVNKQNAEALAILDSNAFPIDQANEEGWTLLHFAAEQGNADMVRTLLERGADPTVKTLRGRTPYDVALGTMIKAALAKAVQAKTGTSPAPAARPAPAATTSAAPAAASTAVAKPQSARDKMCQARWYASQALCSDSTCKMREYRKWATCKQTGSYY